MPAERPGWMVDQQRWRRRQVERVDAFDDTLKELMVDDKDPDGPFWDEVKNLGKAEDSGAFWDSVCAGTHGSTQGAGGTGKLPLDGWDVVPKMTCAQGSVLKGEFASEKEAELNCGSACSSIIDVGCERKRFKMCKMGATEEASTDETCLRRRYPKHRPPEGKPLKPVETEFWKDFCTEVGVRFRLLFDGRLCANGKALEGAKSEGRCAELAKADSECSAVFDIKEATDASPLICRCVKKGEKCAPPPTLAEGTSGAVYIRVETPLASAAAASATATAGATAGR